MIDKMREQFLSLLVDIGFVDAGLKLESVAESGVNRNGRDMEVVKCVICAGLTPNISTCTTEEENGSGKRGGVGGGRKKRLAEIPLKTKGGDVRLHPSSVLASSDVTGDRCGLHYLLSLRPRYRCRCRKFFVHVDAFRTTRIFLKDVTSVTPLMLGLFSSRFKLYDKARIMTINDWLAFRASAGTCSTLIRLRGLVEEAFAERVLHPNQAIPSSWWRIVEAVVTLVHSDGFSSRSAADDSIVEGRKMDLRLKKRYEVNESVQKNITANSKGNRATGRAHLSVVENHFPIRTKGTLESGDRADDFEDDFLKRNSARY